MPPLRGEVVLVAVVLLTAGCQRAGRAPAKRRPASTPAAPRPGHVIANALGMKLAYCPPGEFVMGSPFDEARRENDEARHRVRIGRGFYLGVTEVTQAQWRAVTGRPRGEPKGDDLPVNKVSWSRAVAFCRTLGEKDGRAYRLPTEAEWEYACRAAAASAYAGTGRLDEMGWHMDNSGDEPHPVARKKPNAWGLYDMHGNVAEWCADFYGRDCPTGPVTDPAGPPEGKARVVRGGSFGHFARACRSAARASYNPAYGLDRVGLRVVMEDPNTQNRR